MSSSAVIRMIVRPASAAALGSLAVLAGCAGNSDTQLPAPQAGLQCVDDSKHCIGQREKVFDSYMADKSRAWIRQPAGAHAHASGVRLFALSKKKRELSCEELALGKREADSAPAALRGPAGSGLTPAQVARGAMLAGDVSRELAREMEKRCKRA